MDPTVHTVHDMKCTDILLRYITLPRVKNSRNDGLLALYMYRLQTYLPRKPVKKGFPFFSFFFALGSI